MQPQLQGIILAVLAFAVVFMVGYVALAIIRTRQRDRARQLEVLIGGAPSVALELDSRRDPMPLVTQLLGRSGAQRDIQLKIVQAGLLLRPSELVAISAVCGLIGMVIGFVALELLGAVAGAAVLGIAPWAYISLRRTRRKRALMLQLPNMLDLIGASLRAGHGFTQGLKTAAEQTEPPFKDEVARVLDELRLGLSLEQALDRLVQRTDQADIELVCTAVQIQSRTGGNLAEVLANISGVIRERLELQGEVDALTAEGKISAIILALLPPIMAVVLSIKSPGWLNPLVDDIIGNIILGGGVVLLLIGCAWMYKLVQMDI